MRSPAFRLLMIAFVLAVSVAPIVRIGRGTAQQSADAAGTVSLYFFRDDKIGVAVRDRTALLQDASIYFATLTELFRGPNDAELGAGLSTRLPKRVAVNGSVILENGVATVDLSREFLAGRNEGRAAAPSLLARRMAQIVFTLTQFPEVHSVKFQVDGEAIDALDSDGASVFRPVTRDDYASITPVILVESPGVWERLTSPLRLTGSANTFEANVQYRITDARGGSVIEGFFSATSGSGIRGTFDEEIGFEVTRQGRATLIVFEQSAVDGSEINIVAIPIEIVRAETPTPSETATATPGTPEPATPSATAVETETPTEVPTETATPEPTATEEPIATATTEPTATATATTEPTATEEPTATATTEPTATTAP